MFLQLRRKFACPNTIDFDFPLLIADDKLPKNLDVFETRYLYIIIMELAVYILHYSAMDIENS
jgi:hypothetical protein